MYAKRLVSTFSLKEGVEKFLATREESEWANVPRRHTSSEEKIVNKIQKLQQTSDLLDRLKQSLEGNPDSNVLKKIIKRLASKF